MAGTIALSFLSKEGSAQRPFEGAVITSSFVGNGISVAPGRASSSRRAGPACDGDPGKNCSQAGSLHTRQVQTGLGAEARAL